MSLLSEDSKAEVLSLLLSDLSLEEVLLHPLLVEGYRKECLKRHREVAGTQNSRLLREFYEKEFFFYEFVPFVLRCYWTPDRRKLVLISEYYDRLVGFDLAGLEIEQFDFETHVLQSGVRVDDIFMLAPDRYISDPHEPGGCRPIGQKLRPWHDGNYDTR